MKSGGRLLDPSLLIALVAVLAAAGTMFLYLQSRPPGDGSAEAGFARDMIAHHAQAVEMAEIVRDRTEDDQVRTLATDIALTQQGQIGQMRGWLDVWGLSPTGTEPPMAWMGEPMDGMMPGMATRKEINALRKMPPEEMDKQFLRLMIPHHRAAIPMAKAILERSDRPEVRRLAEAIVAAQSAEIEAMQKMLKDRGASPVKNTPPAGMQDMGTAGMSGEEDHGGGGFTASVPMVARDTVRLALLPLGVFAAAWLGITAVRRSRPTPIARAPVPGVWRAAAVGGLLASALLHIGLAPEHFEEAAAYGVFFSAAGTALAVTAAAVLSWPSPRAYASGAGIALTLVALWAVFRLVPPPGAGSAESVDLVGLFTKAAELVAATACVVLWVRSRRARFAARQMVV